MAGKEFGQVSFALAGLRIAVYGYRQVVTDHDVFVQSARGLDEVIEMRIEFRRAAGDVELCNSRMSLQDFQAAINSPPAHLLGAFGRSVHVAMMTSLIAQTCHVDLQRFNAERRQIEFMPRQLLFK